MCQILTNVWDCALSKCQPSSMIISNLIFSVLIKLFTATKSVDSHKHVVILSSLNCVSAYISSSTKKYLNNSQRIFICPFPIENINPQRKAIVNNKSIETKCFTCGTKEGEINIFGQICNFEKGHLTPIKCENTTNSHWQCKWCNTFYKDKIIWNDITNKPEFNYYAIIRDMKKTEIISILKQLGIQASDL